MVFVHFDFLFADKFRAFRSSVILEFILLILDILASKAERSLTVLKYCTGAFWDESILYCLINAFFSSFREINSVLIYSISSKSNLYSLKSKILYIISSKSFLLYNPECEILDVSFLSCPTKNNWKNRTGSTILDI